MCGTNRFPPPGFKLGPKGQIPFQVPTSILGGSPPRLLHFKDNDRKALKDALIKAWKESKKGHTKEQIATLFIEQALPSHVKLKWSKPSLKQTILTGGDPPQENIVLLQIKISGPFSPKKAREYLKYLGFDEVFIDDFIRFRVRRKIVVTREKNWESFLALAHQYTGLKIREALPDDKSRKRLDQFLEENSVNWYQVRISNNIIGEAMFEVFKQAKTEVPRNYIRWVERTRKKI